MCRVGRRGLGGRFGRSLDSGLLYAIVPDCIQRCDEAKTEGENVHKLIIEARVNEYAMRDVNPHVPWTPSEIGKEAAALRGAGASVLHFHARKPDGSPEHGFHGYADTITAIRATSDLIVHSTLGQITVDGDRARLAHIERLAEDPALRPEFASVDLGSTNIDQYLTSELRFATTDATYVNRTETLIYFVTRMRELGIRPALACWSIPFVRMLEPFFQMQLLDDPAYVLFVHTGGPVLGGHPATPAGLRAFVDTLPPDRPIQWTVNGKPANILAIAAEAIQLGGHVAIGIGDYPYPELGLPTNVELVERVADLARSLGREVATPEETRAILGLDTASTSHDGATAQEGSSR